MNEMVKPQKAGRLNEAQVKLSVGDWLAELGLHIFDERQNKDRPKWGVFEVRSINPGKRPDLVVCGNLRAARTVVKHAYVAIEIKPGYKHHDILDGFDALLEYFSDYLWGTEYWVHGRPIDIAAFVFATLFSRQGFLFGEEGKFGKGSQLPPHIVRGPWDAYPMTFTIARLLWRQKDNLVKRFQALSGIPKVEKVLMRTLHTERVIPEIGVLVQDPAERSILLMLSKNPYHWRFTAS